MWSSSNVNASNNEPSSRPSSHLDDEDEEELMQESNGQYQGNEMLSTNVIALVQRCCVLIMLGKKN